MSELKLHFHQLPGADVSTIPNEISSGRAEKQQTGVWAAEMEMCRRRAIKPSAVRLRGGRANGVKGHQRGGVQYLQPTTGAESKARLLRYKLERRVAELVLFPWLTTIISCEVFAGSEITASSLSRAPLCPSCRQRRRQPDLR